MKKKNAQKNLRQSSLLNQILDILSVSFLLQLLLSSISFFYFGIIKNFPQLKAKIVSYTLFRTAVY